MKTETAIFDEAEIRRVYDEENEAWFFSVVDIIRVLTGQPTQALARNYWKVLKNRLKKEGSEVVTHCNQLRLSAEDGKQRLTDVADAETLLQAAGLEENKIAGKRGGGIARQARKELEEETGRSVISQENGLPPGGED